MTTVSLPVCHVAGLRAIEITADEEPRLQEFFDANQEYFLAVNGEPAGPSDAHDEIRGEPPAGWGFTKKWLIGYLDSNGTMVAMANVVSDLLAPTVWHIGLFVVATARHGTGLAQALHGEIEAWATSNGARWLRLGVVQGNSRAERFWESLGYMELRTRSGIEMGKLTNTVRVMFKPLSGSIREHYLALVPRDQPAPPSEL
jgi:GNAT superfamily N-acetyltransferase